MVYPHAYRTEHSETKTTNSEYGDYYATMKKKKIAIQAPLLKILQHVDSNRAEIVDDLGRIVRIRSIYPEHKAAIPIMKEYIEDWMKKLGAKYESFDIGSQKVGNQVVKLPPITLGTVKGQSNFAVCVYANVDVRAPCTSKWGTDPWEVTEKDKRVFGNGVVLGKGPLICWFHALNAFKKSRTPLPVTVKFIIESMRFNNSIGLKDFLMTQKQVFLYDADYIVINDCEWFDTKHPCICYGVVGHIHFDVFVTQNPGSGQDITKNMEDLFAYIAVGDNVIIPNFEKYVSQITPDEENLYDSIKIDWDEFKKQLPPEKQSWTKATFLMHYWRKPTIFVDHIKSCTCSINDRTKIKRHFIIKIVPQQSPDLTARMVHDYILHLADELKIENAVEVKFGYDTKPWLEDCTSLNYEAARRATIQIYKEDPSFVRDDKSLKSLNILESFEKGILVLPFGVKGSNGGEDNENVPVKNLFENIKLFGAYLFQIAALSAKKNLKLTKK